MRKLFAVLLSGTIIFSLGCQKNSPKEVNEILLARPFHVEGELVWNDRNYLANIKRETDQTLTVTINSVHLGTDVVFVANGSSSTVSQKDYYLTEGASPASQSIAVLIKQALDILSTAEIVDSDTYISLSNKGHSVKIGAQNQEILEISLPYGDFSTKTSKLI